MATRTLISNATSPLSLWERAKLTKRQIEVMMFAQGETYAIQSDTTL
jgi:hypothetical protein